MPNPKLRVTKNGSKSQTEAAVKLLALQFHELCFLKQIHPVYKTNQKKAKNKKFFPCNVSLLLNTFSVLIPSTLPVLFRKSTHHVREKKSLKPSAIKIHCARRADWPRQRTHHQRRPVPGAPSNISLFHMLSCIMWTPSSYP